MKALVFGARADPWTAPPGANRLLRNLAATPGALLHVPDAEPLRPDWVVTRPRPAGILTHAFGVSAWRDAFAALADQGRSGAIKVALDPAR